MMNLSSLPSRVVPAAALGALLLAASSASADVMLTHKFEEGSSVRYRTDQTVTSKIAVGPGTMINEVVQSTWTTRKVTGVEGDKATIEETVDRMSMTTDITGGPMAMSMKWDSDTPDEASGPNVAQINAMLGPIVGAKLTYTVDASGKVSDVSVSDGAKAALAMTAGGDAEAAALTLVQSSLLPMPNRSVAPGTTWDARMESPTQMGTVIVSGPLKLKSADGGTAVIGGDLKASIESDPKAPMKVSVEESDVENEYEWDVEKGRLKGMTGEVALTLSIAMGPQTSTADTVSGTKVTIVEGDE